MTGTYHKLGTIADFNANITMSNIISIYVKNWSGITTVLAPVLDTSGNVYLTYPGGATKADGSLTLVISYFG